MYKKQGLDHSGPQVCDPTTNTLLTEKNITREYDIAGPRNKVPLKLFLAAIAYSAIGA